MAEPFDTIAAQIAEIIKDVSDGAMTEAAAAAALIPLISGLAPVQWEQLAKVIQVLGRVEGQLFTDGVPADTLGVVGSTAIDLTAKVFYGPKTVDGWVTSFSMVGSTGPTGATGATGPTGPTGTVSAAGDGTAGAPGIAFASDPDTGIFRPGSNILGISTGGTERARIDASGNFGIGETSPSAMLHVGNASTTALRVAPASGNVTLTAYQDGAGAHGSATLNAAAWIFQSRSTEAMQVADGGNVGIGTTAPGTKLDVAGVIRTSGGSVPAAANNTALSYVAGSTGQIIIHGPDNSTPGAFQIIGLSANDSAGDIRLGVGSTGHITPGVDNAQNFGSGAARWAQGHFGIVYTADGTVSTSDLRQKVLREGGGLTDVEYEAWSAVRAIVYRDKDSFERRGDDARLHVGYGWQHIKAAFEAQGLDANRYGLWCEDPVLAPVTKTRTATRQARDADGKPQTEVVPVLDAKGKPVVGQVQATEAVEQPYQEVRIVDGAPVLVRGVRTVEQPLYDSVQVRDAETGEAVFYAPQPSDAEQPAEIEPVPMMAAVPRMVSKAMTETVPVMEDYEQEYTEMEPTGETIGALRYQECAVLEAAWLRREMTRIEARVAALEQI